jgi:phage FluMu gp28-like protein
MAAKPKSTPRDLLLPYQRTWADDESRFKIGLMARQVGKDFTSAEEGIRDCWQHELRKDKTTWLIAAPSERQSMESLEKWKEWTEAYKLAIEDVIEEREEKNSEALLKSATIVFPNGSRVIAVPGKPDTVRGYSANILATEFAFFEDPDKTWRALLPSITNPLRGGLKKVRLISTPNGVGNKFHDLWSKNFDAKTGKKKADAKWSTHKVTISDAVAQGLPVDIDELREALDDAEGWAQEYDPLDFLDGASVLLPYDLIAACENPLASLAAPADFWMASTIGLPPRVMGLDFGRKRDLSVAWTLEDVAGFKLTREVLEMEKTSTPEQFRLLEPRVQKCHRVCMDYTGPGIGLGDLLVEKFGEWNPDKHLYGKIELRTFTQKTKCEDFPLLRVEFENRRLGIPVNRTIREDLHSVNRIVTASSGITYRAPHTDDGHADRCTALALAVRAASWPVMSGSIKVFGGKRSRVIASRRERNCAG